MNFKNIFEEHTNLVPKNKTLIHWYDLYRGHYVLLDKDFQKILFQKAIKKAGSFSALGRTIGISRTSIATCSKGKTSPTINILKSVAEYGNIPLNSINKKILRIGSLHPKLPFNLGGIQGAEIRAAFLSDGHVDKNPVKQCQYCAFEKELHYSLTLLCKSVFGDFKTRTRFGNKTYVTKFPAAIGEALQLAGVPRGNKQIANPYIPKDIFLGSDRVKGAYLRRVFDDEGDICFDNYGKRAVRLTRSIRIGWSRQSSPITQGKWTPAPLTIKDASRLLQGEQLALLSLGIDARLYSEGIYQSKLGDFTAKWRIQIGQQDSVRKFSEVVNFSVDAKRKKLQEVIQSYKVRKSPNNKTKEEILKFVQEFCHKKGKITFGDLGKHLERKEMSHDYAGQLLRFFQRIKVIKKVKRGVYVLNDKT